MQEKKLISVIIPLYNEVGTIEKVLAGLSELQCDFNLEVLVVDDGSDDGSGLKIAKVPNITLITHSENLGKTACIVTALKIAKGEVIVIQDADLEYPPQSIPALVRPIVEEGISVVYGRRVSEKKFLFRSRLARYIMSRLFALFFETGLADINTGHKAFNTETLKAIKFRNQRFTFCVEVTFALLMKSVKILEIPVNYFPRKNKDGKKISYFDGFEIIAMVLLLKLRSFSK